MESKNRGIWVFVILMTCVSMVVCCGLALVVAIGVPAIVRSVVPEITRLGPVQVDLSGVERMERIEETFEVGDSPELEVTNFAGTVTVRAGGEGTVRVAATKKAHSETDLEAIQVDMSGTGSRVEVRTSHTLADTRDMSVQLEISVPVGTDLHVRTGAGAVEVRDVQGELQVGAGAGGIEVSGAAGAARLSAGAGSIEYEGSPSGECSFKVGAGGITLRLSRDANVRVDLTAGLGGVHSELPVQGRVTRHSIYGTIGKGGKGSVTATAGVGGIDLVAK